MVQLKIGDKVKGFKFKDLVDDIHFHPDMNKFIGEIGIIDDIDDGCITLQFKDPYKTTWAYPLNHRLAKSCFKIQNKLR